MVSTEPRMELLPEEWQALADLEVAAREIDRLYSPVAAGAIQRPLMRMRTALAELDKARGKVPGIGRVDPEAVDNRALLRRQELRESIWPHKARGKVTGDG